MAKREIFSELLEEGIFYLQEILFSQEISLPLCNRAYLYHNARLAKFLKGKSILENIGFQSIFCRRRYEKDMGIGYFLGTAIYENIKIIISSKVCVELL